MKNVKEMKINHKEVKKLNSFCGVELRGNETFDELLEIEKKNILKKKYTINHIGMNQC